MQTTRERERERELNRSLSLVSFDIYIYIIFKFYFLKNTLKNQNLKNLILYSNFYLSPPPDFLSNSNPKF